MFLRTGRYQWQVISCLHQCGYREIYIHIEVISFWMMGMARTRPFLREETPAYTLSPSKLWRATPDMRII